MRLPRPSWHFILLAFFCVFALAPLTAPGYFIYGHDARHSVYFLQMFDQSVHDGAWYPRWAADMVFGYGYPLWLILAPLPFFAGEAMHLIGLDIVSAVKAVDGLALFFSALTMYFFASTLMHRNAALVAAVAYAYLPYHLVDLYVRSAQAELVAFVFLPLALWAFNRLITSRDPKNITIAALAYAGLVLSHIQTALLFTPVLGIYILVLLWSLRGQPGTLIRAAVCAGLSFALALGIAAVFMLPLAFEYHFLKSDALIGGHFDYRKHFLNPSQLFSAFWGYGYAGEFGNDQFSLQLGLVPILLTLTAVVGWKRLESKLRTHLVFFVLVLCAVILAVLPVSVPLWDQFSAAVAFVQFPWRLLIIAVVALGFLAGVGAQALAESESDHVPILGIALLLVVASYPYTEPQHTEAVFTYQTQMEFEVKDKELLGDTVWMVGERPKDSPLVEQYMRGGPIERAVSLGGNAQVRTVRNGGQSVQVEVEAEGPARILVHTRFFPGWTADLGGQLLPVEPYGDQGLILTTVPPGHHTLNLRFQDTPVRQIGALISAASIAFGLLILGKSKKV